MTGNKVVAMDKKEGQGLLGPYERKLKLYLVNFVPKSVETYHLTYTTLLWSALIVLFGVFISSPKI